MSKSQKSLEITVNAQSEVSRGTKRCYEVSRGIMMYREVSRGIKKYQEV